MTMQIKVDPADAYSIETERVIKDLLYVYDHKKMFINEKGYLQKLIDMLWDLGYYKRNESLFIRKGD